MLHVKQIHKIGSLLAALFFMATLVSCGGNAKQTLQAAPEGLIKNYISKHETMIDPSLVDYYIENEKKEVLDQVNLKIAETKQNGSLLSLQQATFDLSGLNITVVDQVEEYVNDEIADFMKVTASGEITMNTKDQAKKISINSTIILEKESGAWKVTEKINPWQKTDMFSNKKPV